jgi:diguanylate cyclase (GGDEF)-like protein
VRPFSSPSATAPLRQAGASSPYRRTIDRARSDKLLASMKRTQVIIALAYLYDTFVLLGFAAAGFVDLAVPFAVFSLLATSTAAVMWAHITRRSLKLRDPTLFLPQQIYAVVVALGVALVAPQIGFQPIATLFAISAFSFMAPNQKSLVVCWIAAALGAVAVIFIAGPRLAIPISTLSGQALTGAVVIGLLARCIWIAMSFRTLQRRISAKNEALRSALQRLQALANRDDLTGMPNRHAIAEWLAEQMTVCRRTGAPLSIALLDLDHFKQINDTFGHLAGDRTLQLFAKQALDAIRDSDRLGRYGGGEFLLVMVGAGLHDVNEPLERIRKGCANLDWSAIDPGLRLTITTGATQCAPGDTVETLMRRADLALYLGKESGRDRVVLDPTPVEQLKSRSPIAAE